MSRIKSLFLSLLLFLSTLASAQTQNVLSEEMQKVRSQAEAGDAAAQYRLALAHDTGKGAPRDGKEALKWYKAAAGGGNPEAQSKIGMLYHMDKQYDDARSWYEKAAAQDHPMGTHYLATLYDMGTGVEQDRKKAFGLYLKAAELGAPDAMWRAAYMLDVGLGVESDKHLSCVWTHRANKFVTLDNHIMMAMVGKQISRFTRELPPEELAKCKEQADAWAPPAVKSDKQS